MKSMKHLKKFSAVFFSMILFLTVCLPLSVFAEGQTVDPDPQEDAKLYVQSVQKPVLKAGDIVQFPLQIGSRSYDYAKDLRISITGTGDYEKSFSVNDASGWYKMDEFVNKATVTPTLQVASDLPDGKYTLNVKFEYADAYGYTFSSTDTIKVTIYGKSGDTAYIKSAAFQSAEIGKTNKSKLNVNIYNSTKNSIYNTKVTFDTAKNDKFSLYENFRPAEIASINPGETKAAVFSVYVGDLATGNYPLTLTLSYSDAAGTVFTSTETIYVMVTRSAEAAADKGSKPRIIISKYKTDSEVINAGQSFTLDFTLQNTSNTTAVTNVKVVLGSEQASGSGQPASTSTNVFFPSEGSNSFFIEKIPPKGTASESIKLTTSRDVEPGVYALNLEIEYDADGAAATPSTEKLSFPIAQEQRLDIQNFMPAAGAVSGTPMNVSFQYINKGKATIYNFSIGVEGDFTLNEGGGYIGNLTSGYNDTADLMIMPTGEGECKGAILLKYEDSQGKEKEERKEFTVNVTSMETPTGGDMGGGAQIDPETGYPIDPATGLPIDPATGKPVQKGGILPIILWSAGGVVVVGGGVAAFLIIRKKRKAKKELVEDEED